MIETFFISDTHFGHKNILQYEPDARPFETVEEMNEVLIERWNSVVKSRDIIYHLGDFAFGKRNISIASRLNGKKRLILGNHDCYPVSEYYNYFERVYGAFCWNRCILTHIPIHPGCLGSGYFLNVHGHLHSKVVTGKTFWDETLPDMNYFNVS